jgi:hypothetical protein
MAYRVARPDALSAKSCLSVNSVSQVVLDLTSLLCGLAIVFQPFPGNVLMC